MTGKKKEEPDPPVEIPDSRHWTVEQAIAMAGRKRFEEVVIVGRDQNGEVNVIDGGRLDLSRIVLLLKEADLVLFGLG